LQAHRGGGDWGGKGFNLGDGSTSSISGSSDGDEAASSSGGDAGGSMGQQLPLMRQRLQTTQVREL